MKLSVWGAGLIGRKHAQLAAQRDCLASVVDPCPNAKALAEDLECQHFETPEACLDAQELDGVIIATPNQLHVEHATLCVENGLPAMIEKPIADQAANASQLIERAENLGIPLLVAHHRRHNPIIQRAARCVKEGDLGQIHAVSGHFLLYKPEDYFENSWRRRAGAGPIFINLIHDIDLLRFLVGEIRCVRAVQSSNAREFEVEDTAAVILEFSNGAVGTFVMSDAVSAPWSWEFSAGENPDYPHIPGDAYRIAGSNGSLSVPDLKYYHHPEGKSWWSPMEVKQLNWQTADPLEQQLAHFLDVCRGVPPLVSGMDGLRSLEVVEAIKTAAVTGAPVTLKDGSLT